MTTVKMCMMPPASMCLDANTLRKYDAAGTCSGGNCQYTSHDVSCPGCPACDPCVGVTCNTPPASVCKDASNLTVYSAPGTCSNGTCSYTSSNMFCPYGCMSGACNTSCHDCWAKVAPMPTARYGAGAAFGSDGKIYVIGGTADGTNPLGVIEVYDPGANLWTKSTTSMVTPRSYFATVVGADNKIYTIGGAGGTLATDTSTVEAYTPGGAWSTAASIATARSYLGAALGTDNLIYAMGGETSSTIDNQLEAYSTSSNAWTSLTAMPTARSFIGVATGGDGLIYTIGGYATTSTRSAVVEAYAPGGSWATKASLPAVRSGVAAATAQNGHIYAFGGRDSAGTPIATVYSLTPGSSAWASAAAMPTARSAPAVAVSPDGKMYLIGGVLDSAGNPTAAAEVYTP
jgi:N-acetylneuraminic acid mutarotase